MYASRRTATSSCSSFHWCMPSSWNTISVTPAECMVGRKRLFTASSAKAEVSSTHMSRRSIFAFQYFTIEDMAPRICSDTAGLLQADRQTISSITFVITSMESISRSRQRLIASTTWRCICASQMSSFTDGSDVASSTCTSSQFVHMLRSAMKAMEFTSSDATFIESTSRSMASFFFIFSTVSLCSEYSRSTFTPFSCTSMSSGKAIMPLLIMLTQSSWSRISCPNDDISRR